MSTPLDSRLPPFDFTYERDQAPFLALCRGSYGFLHTSADRVSGVAVRQLSLAPLGRLAVPSGSLVIGDPFRGLRGQHNPRYVVPQGEHRVVQTMAKVGEDDRIAAMRTAYISVIFREDLVGQRVEAQRGQVSSGQDPALAESLLELAPKALPDGSYSQEETRRMLEPGIPVLTGFLAMSDAQAFEERMPMDRTEPGQGWLENLFEHGVDGSWFDLLDADQPWPKGSSNHLLPGSAAAGGGQAPDGQANVVVCQTGWGDGRYLAWLETHAGQAAALHVDFQVIPSDPMQRWRQ